jgi:hypothetical protein
MLLAQVGHVDKWARGQFLEEKLNDEELLAQLESAMNGNYIFAPWLALPPKWR